MLLYIFSDTNDGICTYNICGANHGYASSKEDGDGQILCYCDDECTFYNDCCDSYQLKGRGREGRSDVAMTSCVQMNVTWPNTDKTILGNILLVGGYRIVSECPSNWNDDVTRSNCESPNEGSDFTATTPITAPNNVSFMNVYCAMCHGVYLQDVEFWGYNFTKCSDFLMTMIDDLINNSQWDAVLGNAIDESECDRSRISYSVPSGVTLRHCVVNQLSSCPANYTDTRVSSACQSHIALRSSASGLYRNSYCARCHGVDASVNASCGIKIIPGILNVPPLSILFGFQPDDTTLSSQSASVMISGTGLHCNVNEMYDPFTRKCRALYCKSGFRLKRGQCVPHFNSQSNCTLNKGTIRTKFHLPNGFYTDIGCRQNVLEICPPIQTLVYQRDASLVHCRQVDCNDPLALQSDSQCSTPPKYDDFYIDIELQVENISIKDIENELIYVLQDSYNSCLLLSMQITIQCYGNWTAHNSCKNESYDWEEVTIYNGTALVQNTSKYNIREVPFDMTYAYYNVNQSVEQIYTFYICNDQCPETRFAPGTFKVKGTSVILLESSKELSESEYRLVNNSIFVCSNLISHKNIFQFDTAQSIITLIGTILSLLALLVSFFTYVIFPSLRNLPGKSVMCLIVSLFTGQLLLLLVGNATKNPPFCTAVAIILHYVWLASFSWTSTVAFYLSRTLGSQAKPRATEHRDCDSRFMKFSLHGWGSPFIVVFICIIVEFCSDINIMYGTETVCWIGNRLALMTSFFVPIAVNLLVNAFLYARILIYFTFRGGLSSGPSMDKLRKKRLKRDSLVSLKVGHHFLIICDLKVV